MNYKIAKVKPLLGSQYLPAVSELVKTAKKSIYVIQYQWKWNPHERNSWITMFTGEIIKAHRRGVIVKVILNLDSINHPLGMANSATVKKLQSVGIHAHLTHTSPITHAKMFIIDDLITIVGSHNLSKNAVHSNDETSVMIKSDVVSKQYKEYFKAIWERY